MLIDSSPTHTASWLAPAHFAFMRAVLQGLDPAESWARYLQSADERPDLRRIRGTINAIRDEFAAAARRDGRHGLARLVLLDAETIDRKTSAPPSLDEFVLHHGLEDFPEAEQLELFAEHYRSATPNHTRRARLLQRQLDALQWLERRAVRAPRLADALDLWLNIQLARRLQAYGLATVEQLIAHINGHGHNWWRPIGGLGETKAARIVEWIQRREAVLGLALGPHVVNPAQACTPGTLNALVQPGTAIVPLEKFVFPAALCGKGQLHLPGQPTPPQTLTDLEAIHAWLARKAAPASPGASPHTARAYWKEVERFCLWSVLVRARALSQIESADCAAYMEFLRAPSPPETWCAPRGTPRWSPLWRPFEGPLSIASRRRAAAVLRAMYAFWEQAGYVAANPWRNVDLVPNALPAMNTRRRLSPGQWSCLQTELANLTPTSVNLRLQVGVHLMHATGITLGEAAALTLDALHRAAPQTDEATPEGWRIMVRGRGGRCREVDVPSDVMTILFRYLAARGLPQELSSSERSSTHLLGRSTDVQQSAPWSRHAREPADPRAGIAPSTLYEQIKGFFAACARKLEPHDPATAAGLAKATTHWLRHSFGTAAAADGMPREEIAKRLGHASVQTARLYEADIQRTD